jgi:hypothetical protein
MHSARRAALASIGLILVRRRLRRSQSLAAPLALVALDVVGPRVFLQLRRLAVRALALTIVGCLLAGLVWWSLRRRSRRDAGGVVPVSDPSVSEDGGVELQPDPAVA